jgi:dihydrofolate reductase
MRKLVYYIGVSLDGYIAGPGGEYDFYPLADDMAAWLSGRYPETIPTHARAGTPFEDAPHRRFDTVVMGRGTYQPALDIGIASPYAHLDQYVVSASLTVADPAVNVVPSDPVGLVRRLKQESGGDVWLCGGGHLAGQLVPEIDELIFKTYPVVAGGGRPVIDGSFAPTQFRLVEQQDFSNGAYVSSFVRA